MAIKSVQKRRNLVLKKLRDAQTAEKLSEIMDVSEAWKKKMLKRIMRRVAKTQKSTGKSTRLQRAIQDMHVVWKIRDLEQALLKYGISQREINRSLRPVEELVKVHRKRVLAELN